MTRLDNGTRIVTIRKVLANPHLLDDLREQDREELIQQYMAELEKWENRKKNRENG